MKKLPLYIEIQTNLSCNFRCTYCYEEFDNSKIDFETAKLYIDALYNDYINKSGIPNRIILAVIGGEPLLELKLLDRLFQYVFDLVKVNDLKSEVVFHLMSNLSLLKSNKNCRDFILKYQDQLVIKTSLDGNEYGNANRVKLNSNSTFNDVLWSIDWIKTNTRINKEDIHITSVITKYSIPNLTTALKFLIDLDIGQLKFNFDQKEQYTTSEGSMISLAFIQAIDYYFQTQARCRFGNFIIWNSEKPKITSVSSGKYDPTKSYGCSVFKPTKEIARYTHISTNGKIYSCLKMSSKEHLKHLYRGKVENHKLQISENPDFDFGNILPDLCKTCRFLDVCDKCVLEELDTEIADEQGIKQKLTNKLSCNITKPVAIISKYAEMKKAIHYEEYTN